MKRINAVLAHLQAAREEALTLKVRRDRRRMVRKIDNALAHLALIERGWTRPKKVEKEG